MTKATENKATATETKQADDGIKAKIAALLAKAEGTDNAHEAEAFMSKAMDMLDKYQLARWELGVAGDEMGQTAVWKTNLNPVTWRKYLIQAVAAYYGATSLMVRDGKGMLDFKICGRESARITTEAMLPFLIDQVKAAGAKLAETDPTMNAKRHTRRVAHALTIRLSKLTAERNEAKKGKAQERALVLVDELESYMQSLNTKTAKGGKIGTTGSARDAADKISLAKQTEGGKATAAIAKG